MSSAGSIQICTSYWVFISLVYCKKSYKLLNKRSSVTFLLRSVEEVSYYENTEIYRFAVHKSLRFVGQSSLSLLRLYIKQRKNCKTYRTSDCPHLKDDLLFFVNFPNYRLHINLVLDNIVKYQVFKFRVRRMQSVM